VTDRAVQDESILDDVRIVHELRALLWRDFGEKTVPHMWVRQGECGLRVRGSDGKEYTVTVMAR
jgi:hypothetical protein